MQVIPYFHNHHFALLTGNEALAWTSLLLALFLIMSYEVFCNPPTHIVKVSAQQAAECLQDHNREAHTPGTLNKGNLLPKDQWLSRHGNVSMRLLRLAWHASMHTYTITKPP